jgi:hypothetical protein
VSVQCQKVSQLRLIPLKIGQIPMHMARVAGEESTAVFPVLSWLVEHARGLVLIDTGMHIDLQTSNDRIAE